MGRDAEKYDCPPCINQIRSKLIVPPATVNFHWFSRLSRSSHSRITLTALRAFRKRPKTTVLQYHSLNSIARAAAKDTVVARLLYLMPLNPY